MKILVVKIWKLEKVMTVVKSAADKTEPAPVMKNKKNWKNTRSFFIKISNTLARANEHKIIINQYFSPKIIFS